MKTLRSLLALLAMSAMLSGCGSSDVDGPFPAGAFAIRASSDIGVGPSRLLVGIATEDGTRLGGPDVPVRFELAPLDGEVAMTVDATFMWIVPDALGLYRASATFDAPGAWSVTVVPKVGPPLEAVPFLVVEQTAAPGIGAVAPAVATPTVADYDMSELTTDAAPDESFYQVSLADAIAAGDRIVVVFSTPAYCQTAACGPILEQAKDVSATFPAVTFIHVEVYTGLTEPGFAPDAAHLAPSAGPAGFNLPSEPWVFVIDESGVIVARFEGVLDSSELVAAIE